MENIPNDRMAEEAKDLIHYFSQYQPRSWEDAVAYFSKGEEMLKKFFHVLDFEKKEPSLAGSYLLDLYADVNGWAGKFQTAEEHSAKAKKTADEERPKEPQYQISTKPIVSFIGDSGERELFYLLATLTREEEGEEDATYVVLLPANPDKETEVDRVVFFHVIYNPESGEIEKYEGVSDKELAAELLDQYIEENMGSQEFERQDSSDNEFENEMEISGFDDEGNETKFIYHGTLFRKGEDGEVIEYLAITPQNPKTEKERYAMSFLEVIRNEDGDIEDLIGVFDQKLAQDLVEQFKKKYPDFEI